MSIPNRVSPSESRIARLNEAVFSTLEQATSDNLHDDPKYYARTPRELLSTSNSLAFETGTGSTIYETLRPLLESANHELILVTCFWAQSKSLDTINDILVHLSHKGIEKGVRIRVRICFSSLSIFQKLFHTQKVSGQTYPPSVWRSKLGLPSPEMLTGLDLEIKSVFLLPFSVMHPKFMIVDRRIAVMPSCNVSWEKWFEGYVKFTGPAVNDLLKFYSKFWERREELPPLGAEAVAAETSHHGSVPTFLLPSPHRRNPRFQPFTSTENVRAPHTPLNAFILTLIDKANSKIIIQTPNLTSPPVLSALLKALARGVDVQITTSENLMVIEQLVTAGTTTPRCVRKLRKRHMKLVSEWESRVGTGDEEAIAGLVRPGNLQLFYFRPKNGLKRKGQENGEPQQSHLKMMVVDDDVVVLGSGNLDRASWFTSQELGIAFFDRRLVAKVIQAVEASMNERRVRVTAS
ncbi:phospholipase D/nuclease [Westerdykella ornata]|uniref:Phospholipase D/nuclease n=1 Tax=Westerdykella ornata TaxID=318751 RepID=A0A6A6JGP0_WESOR|nr:phospholipase D/nuclease [Westerdykella ornata]KAF2275364.1 phospholipase D/nuclease [Westerdykella ornata]